MNSFLSNVGKEFKAVFAWLGSAQGQNTVAVVEGAVEIATTAVNPAAGAGITTVLTLINSWASKAITTEAIAAAAEQQDGTSTQKAAATIAAITPEIEQAFPNLPATQVTAINNAVITLLNLIPAIPAPAK
jgi:hypothetical protein